MAPPMTTLLPDDDRSRRRHRPDPAHAANRYQEIHVLKGLWNQHAARPGTPEGDEYLRAHFGMDITLERHLRVIDMMAAHVRGRVLEWGCRHGLDSCIYRMRRGDSVELHGCDVCEPGEYSAFHQFSGLRYRQLNHPSRLDFEDATFDVVTSNGVLEHVPEPVGSVHEIHRVLRPGGVFVVTCLPNRYSYTEALQRWRGATAHDRLYSLGSTRDLLRSAGFRVVSTRRFFMVPTMLNGFPEPIRRAYQRAGGLVWKANDLLERAWPVNVLASNLMVVATKTK